jgi:surface-anchored protein
MKLIYFNRYPLAAAIMLGACSLNAAEKIVWSEGHGDISIQYTAGEWQWFAEEGKEVGDVIIRLNDVSRSEIPDLPAFAFLGPVGDPIWILPAGQTAGIPFMGVNAEGVALGTFTGDRMSLRLTSVSGPGHIMAWTTSGTGMPTLLMNSRDGLDAADKAEVLAGGHFHANWGFTQPGTYRAGFTASGTSADGGAPVTSEEAVYTFEVNVIKGGEADIEVAYEGGELEFHVHDEAADAEFEPGHVALQAGSSSGQIVPENPAFAFLGEPGASIYVLPQEETAGVLFLGLAGGEVEPGTFVNDALSIRLLDVQGPGHVAYYQVSEFGAPVVSLNSGDGITGADVVTVAAGSHAHRNWAFSAPGIYRITLQAAGTLSAGPEVVSAPTTFLFEVESGVQGPSLNASLANGDQQLLLSWNGTAGAVYQLQARATVGAGEWLNEGTPVTGTDGQQAVTADVGSERLRVFRLIQTQL